MRKLPAALFFILLTVYGGCGDSNEKVPPTIIPGQDVCDNCYMLINEEKYAAAVTLINGEEKRFDDISCMLSYRHSNNEKIKYYWVYDYISDISLQAEKAFYVKSKKEITPMGGGIIAFGQREEAKNFADKENKAVINFKELVDNNN